MRIKHILSAVYHSKERNEVIKTEQTQIYDDSFYKKFTTTQKIKNSNVIFPLIEKYLEIKSVVDIGCGVGAWSKYFFDNGVYLKGYDFDWVPDEYMAIPKKDYFVPCDLNKRLDIKEQFDLVINLEVAEHLKPERAETFVEDLTKLGDVILFSAAIPYQGGDGHLNEQFPEYWGRLFNKFNYVPIDLIRPQIWRNNEIEQTWVKQNIILFVKYELASIFPEKYKANASCLTRLFFLRFLKIRKLITT